VASYIVQSVSAWARPKADVMMLRYVAGLRAPGQ